MAGCRAEDLARTLRPGHRGGMKILPLLGGAAVGLLSGALIAGTVYLWTPGGAPFDAEEARRAAQGYDVEIIRDEYGVPHIIGQTDADAHFGLAYAHAEDDWATIQQTLVASRGRGSEYYGKGEAPADFMFDLFRVEQTVNSNAYNPPEHIRAITKAYADGMNLFAAEHPDEIAPGLLPITENDIHAGVMWATPFFYRLDGYLAPLFSDDGAPQVSPWDQEAFLGGHKVIGSNGFAVAPSRSADGHTRLIVNSHQPMTGRYAWYEAHLMSGEGLNIFGGTFPGTPIIPQGITPTTAWTHTVNRPDLVDIYRLEVDDEDDPQAYRLDGEWREFERDEAEFRVKLFGPFSLPIKRDALWSEHGPVISSPKGHFAVKFAGLTETRAVEQWLAMGKARNMAEWRDALDINGVLSFNIIYGDADGNIGAVYNGRMPNRIEGPDWQDILPGDDSKLIWDSYRKPTDLPQIWNPECGWVFSANASPFKITDPACDLKRSDFSKTFGIEYRMTNRARRAVKIISPDESITRDELLRYRSDTRYDPEHQLMQLVVELVTAQSDDPLTQQAQEVLRNWDGDTTQDNRGAALAVMTGVMSKGGEYEEDLADPMEALRYVSETLMERFGRLDPEWGEVNRIVRGDVSMPLDGAPDVLRAIYGDPRDVASDGVMNALAGDTHIMIADWDAEGRLRAQSIMQYGASQHPDSPHYNDQVELFATGAYRDLTMTEDEVRAAAVRSYRPGQED